MNELDEIYFRSLSNEALGSDSTALNAVKWDRVEDNEDGYRYGHDDMTGQQFVLGEVDPPPVTSAPSAPPVAEKELIVFDDPSSFGKFLGELSIFLNAPFAGITEGVARVIGNTAGATGLVDQKDVDKFFKYVDDMKKTATEGNPAANVLNAAGVLTGQYILPAVIGYKALRGMGAKPLEASIVSESITGLLGLSPNDENIFNMIANDTSSPAWKALRELMATDPDDHEWVNRSRNAGEALIMLGTSEALMRGLPPLVRRAKQFVASKKGQQVVKYVEEMGARADARLRSMSLGTTLSVNPVGAAGDLALSAAGKLARKDEPAPVFFSAVRNAVDALPMDKGGASQMRAMIAKSEGVKAEEMAWTGLDDFLKGKKSVTKAEIKEYMDANQVRVEEVVKSGDFPQRTGDEWESLMRDAARRGDWDEAERLGAQWEAADLQAVGLGAPGDAKFSSYTLPGGENYREVLLTLPEKRMVEGLPVYEHNGKFYVQKLDRQMPNSGDRSYKTAEAANDAAFSTVGQGKRTVPVPGQTFTGGHFDEPNVLAHIRMNDRTGPDGERILFIEEIQSDWHQKGRKQGYKTPDYVERLAEHERLWTNLVQKHATIINDLSEGHNIGGTILPDGKGVRFWSRNIIENNDYKTIGRIKENGTFYLDEGFSAENPLVVAKFKELAEINVETRKLEESKPVSVSVPDAPLKKTWHETSLRRVIRMAAEEGYDSVAWTPGRMQADRYDLSKQIDELTVERAGDTFGLIATMPGGGTHDFGVFKSTELEDVVGKDLAKKIIKQHQGGDVYDASDLEVGGEGMKAFYDKILKNYASKFGKKFGAKVGTTDIGTGNELYSLWNKINESSIGRGYSKKEAMAKVNSDPTTYEMRLETGGTEKVWNIPITKKMRKIVLKKGVPLFSAAGAAAVATQDKEQPAI